MVLPPLSYDLDLGKTPIKPISSDNEIKVIEHFSIRAIRDSAQSKDSHRRR